LHARRPRAHDGAIGARLAILGVFATLVACGGGDAVDDVLEVGPPGPALEGKADLVEGNVEIKINLRADQIDRARSVFHLQKDRASARDVYFYDQADLALSDGGLILRARRIDGAPDDSTVKLRPMDPDAVAASWFDLAGFKCEEDRVGGAGVTSCSLTVAQDQGEIDAVAAGDRGIDKLFSADEEALTALRGDVVDWTALEVLGPTAAWVWKVKVRSFGRRITFELWELPDATTLLEASTRVTAAEADQVQQELEQCLAARGFDVSSAGETKTRAALDYFGGR
jgi:hypothetical protein